MPSWAQCIRPTLSAPGTSLTQLAINRNRKIVAIRGKIARALWPAVDLARLYSASVSISNRLCNRPGICFKFRVAPKAKSSTSTSATRVPMIVLVTVRPSMPRKSSQTTSPGTMITGSATAIP